MTSTLTTTDTFYESTIRVDLGDNPNRPRPGRDWLANPYRVHQRIMWALDGAREQNRPLFRIYRDRVIVRTTTKPDWTKPFLSPDVGTRGHYQAAFMLERGKDGPILPLAEPWNRELAVGGCYYFELLANLVKSSAPEADETEELTKSGKIKRKRGKRGAKGTIITNPEAAVEWLARRLNNVAKSCPRSGLELVGSPQAGDSFCIKALKPRKKASEAEKSPISEAENAHESEKRRNRGAVTLNAIIFRGVIRVLDSDAAKQTLIGGIGRGRAFGCGMLILGNQVVGLPT